MQVQLNLVTDTHFTILNGADGRLFTSFEIRKDEENEGSARLINFLANGKLQNDLKSTRANEAKIGQI